MARGRPALATVLMTPGSALAVPGSVAFAGEFLILAGVYGVGWGWAACRRGAIVLAAMYMLRLISAVLHQARGFDVSISARPPVRAHAARPLVGLLLFLGLAGPDLERLLDPTPTSTGSRSRRSGVLRPRRSRCSAACSFPVGCAALRSVRRSRRLCHGRCPGGGRLRQAQRQVADRGVVHARPARRVRGDHPRRCRCADRARLVGEDAVTTRASTTRFLPRPARAWRSS